MQETQSVSARPTRNFRSTLVEPFKQIKFGLYIFLISLVFLVACGGVFFQSFWDQYKHVMGLFQVVDPDLQWELVTNDVFFNNLARVLLLFFVFLVVMFYAVFKLTHKYYGPLVSIERFVDEMTRGDYSKRISIRKGDELQRLVSKLNSMAHQLEQRKFEGRHRHDDDAKNEQD